MADVLVIQSGGLGGGYLECDGVSHVWVVPEYKQFACLERTPRGPCQDASVCREAAKLLIEKAKAEEAAQAKAAADAEAQRVKAAEMARLKQQAVQERQRQAELRQQTAAAAKGA